MDKLWELHFIYLNLTKALFRRNRMDEIDWTNRLIAIKGARGVGKTTMILQRIKEQFGNSEKALYVAMDQLALSNMKIVDIAAYLVNYGATHLFIDEVHKYENWSKEIKSIYDLYPSLHIIITGSSILHLYSKESDLSRRMVSYELNGLSFREFLNIETACDLPSYSINEIIENHLTITHDLVVDIPDILPYFQAYLKYGYYPYYLENKASYPIKLLNTVNLTLDIDLAYIEGVNVHNIFKIKKLIHMLALQVPFQPNITKLAASLDLSRSTLSQYFYYLENAQILNLLMDANKSYSHISKPEKIYLHNTNLAYALDSENVNPGTVRETFACNQLKIVSTVHTAKKGDFLVKEKYTFEIGGRTKTNKQIQDIPDAYVLADETLHGTKKKIPLYLLGFLY